MISVLSLNHKVRKSKQPASCSYKISGKLIITDFRTNCNKKVRKEDKMYKNYVELRDKKGITDYQVSKDTGIPKSTFSDWKSGRSKPKADKLKILADYFGVEIGFFLE